MKVFFASFLGLGVFILMQVLSPVLAFKVWEITYYDSSQLLADPLSFSGQSGGGQVLGVSISNVYNFPAFVAKGTVAPPYKEFNLAIPSIKLEKTKVLVWSNDFENSLASLADTALPGEKGNVFVSGHSSLVRELALKGDKAFFANLPKIKKNDEVFVEAIGQRYIYQVVGTKIVEPKDTYVINPPDNEGRYLTLMTCVPPGFNTKRLIVLTKLKQ